VDGISGCDRPADNEWLGWKENVTITVNLGVVRDIAHIGIGTHGGAHTWIHLPREVTIGTSTDGERFTEIATLRPCAAATGRITLGSDVAVKALHVRLAVKSAVTIQEGFPGTGNPAWLFLDEIEVR